MGIEEHKISALKGKIAKLEEKREDIDFLIIEEKRELRRILKRVKID